MRIKPIAVNQDDFPDELHPYLDGAKLYDNSCSENAKVIFIDKDDGYFLKVAAIADLEREHELTSYFHSKGLAANVVSYTFDIGHDYLLTERIPGDDCTAEQYLAQPERLAEMLGERLAVLHQTDCSDSDVPPHTTRYLNSAESGYLQQRFDPSLFPNHWSFASPEEAYALISANKHRLKTDTLIHGDYCLPNIILDDWRFSGFVDLDSGGVGDRHIDLFWGAWTLFFNLKTDKYLDRFLDAYGRSKFEEEMLRLVAACKVFA